ncbi:PmoA family protein [Demequina globuliformis]|uniref:DUF6807 domain-containing protein n=1 Tax=Demequina globuliformis TaxID=676202 RepID=UPI000A9401D6|nr:PmoA family protein [Demequina globuliformis]
MVHLHASVKDDRVVMSAGDVELAHYVTRPTDVRLESPRPYLSPIRTLAGDVVSLFRPHDHVWHKGIAWSLPVVGDENFWGGPTFVRGQGYVQLPNNGEQRHVSIDVARKGEALSLVHHLDWVTEAGEHLFAERRELGAAVVDDRTWELTFATTMTSLCDHAVSLGSPTTRGRDNAGYGGLFWRGPRSFTGGPILAPGGEGGDELRGARAPWMGFRGTHDGSGAVSTVVMVDAPTNEAHPPQWFARSEDFACLCPAPFFSTERLVEPGSLVREEYAVLVHDGGWDVAQADAAATAAATRLMARA